MQTDLGSEPDGWTVSSWVPWTSPPVFLSLSFPLCKVRPESHTLWVDQRPQVATGVHLSSRHHTPEICACWCRGTDGDGVSGSPPPCANTPPEEGEHQAEGPAAGLPPGRLDICNTLPQGLEGATETLLARGETFRQA